MEALHRANEGDQPVINEIVYAELAAAYDSEDAMLDDLRQLAIPLERSPQAALFLAGRAFAAYRGAGGPRLSLLPNCLIGAHAQAAGLSILTRDPRRYRFYFPTVTLVTP